MIDDHRTCATDIIHVIHILITHTLFLVWAHEPSHVALTPGPAGVAVLTVGFAAPAPLGLLSGP